MSNRLLAFLKTTGHEQVDRSIGELVKYLESRWPGALRSVYVGGSHANGYALPTSDLDLYLIVSEELTKEDLESIENLDEPFVREPLSLDPVLRKLSELKQNGVVEMSRHYRHIGGEELHHEIPNPPLEDYIYKGMHGGYLRMQLTRKEKPYTWPMNFPDEQDPWKGYAWRSLDHEGQSLPSLKEIVVLTGWMATGLIAWKGQKYVATKQQCPDLFDEVVGGSVARAFREVTEAVRERYHYLIPKESHAQAEIRDLLPKVLEVENYFLREYRDFLTENLDNSDPKRARTSEIRLKEIELNKL